MIGTLHDVLIHCNYILESCNNFYLIKKKLKDVIFSFFVKHTLNVEFFKYDFVETNIVKLSLMNLSTFNILSIYGLFLSNDLDLFTKTFKSKVIEYVKNKGGYWLNYTYEKYCYKHNRR